VNCYVIYVSAINGLRRRKGQSMMHFTSRLGSIIRGFSLALRKTLIFQELVGPSNVLVIIRDFISLLDFVTF